MEAYCHRRVLVLLTLGVACVFAGMVGWAQTAAPVPAPREVPARMLPVPDTVSPESQRIIGAPPAERWNNYPKTLEEWTALAAAPAQNVSLQPLRDRFGVKSEPMVVNGVKAYGRAARKVDQTPLRK